MNGTPRSARHHPGIAILGAVLTALLALATAGSMYAAARFREQALANGLLAHEKELGKQAERERRQADDERQKAENLVVEMHTAGDS